MAVNKEPIFIGKPLTVAANTSIGTEIDVGDSTSVKNVVSGATDGTVIQDLVAVNSTADEKSLNVYINDGTTDWPLGQVVIPASAGDSATPAVSLLNDTDIPSLAKRDDGSILLASGQKLAVAATADLEAYQVITVVALGGNLTA